MLHKKCEKQTISSQLVFKENRSLADVITF